MDDAPIAARHPQVHVQKHARDLPLRVGTRGSPLALVQTRAFLAVLRHFCPVLGSMDVFEEHVITTTGDTTQDSGQRLADIGGKGLWAKEIHEALVDGRVDFAVHSLKDLETALPPGIVLACTLKREDARDALILGPRCGAADPAQPLAALPAGAHVGTSSVRRQAQLLHARPDLKVAPLRGNVQTRLDKVANGVCDATLLALAGLRRLGLDGHAALVFDAETMVPAAGQGIVGVTVRADQTELRELLAAIEDPEARAVAQAERALLAELDGSCRTPIGGHARLLPSGELHLTGLVARPDGSFLLRRGLAGPPAEAARIGRELGRSLRADSPPDIFG
jgi:hydroxymethylbilane synthase